MKIKATVRSVRGVRIRLTHKQWNHIITARPKLKGFQRQIPQTVEEPDEVYAPPPHLKPQLHAIKRFEELAKAGLAEFLVVVYRELTPMEGFIITAFPISDRRKQRKYQQWQRVYP